MSEFPQLRILHLSDLHFGKHSITRPADGTGSPAGIPTLHELIHGDLTDPEWQRHVWTNARADSTKAPLIIAVTGDLTEACAPSEFDEAYECLKYLASQSILGSSPTTRGMFVIPGNHDVRYDQSMAEHRFTNYCQFYNKLFREIQPNVRAFARPEDAESLTQIHTFPESRLLIAEINSCYFVEKETPDESRGQVDLRAIAGLRKALDAAAVGNDWIRVALVHHHPVLLPSFIEPGRGVDAVLNAGSLLRLLRDHRFQLVLHGHKHYPQIFSYDPDSAWSDAESAIPQLIVAGGSVGSRELPNSSARCNTYNLITVKWNPKALQARVQVITRGLTRTSGHGELDPDQWRWQTLRVFDRVLSPYENLPLPRRAIRAPFPEVPDDLEKERAAEYEALRFNIPVIEVLPSLMPGQGYEARVWLVRHRHHKESPMKVTWSAGGKFPRKVCGSEEAPDFCASFHYWGPVLVQAHMEFQSGPPATSYVYARLPDEFLRR